MAGSQILVLMLNAMRAPFRTMNVTTCQKYGTTWAQPTGENGACTLFPTLRHCTFATLTPDVVLDALASVGLYGDGRLMALSSYETASTRPRWRMAAAWWPSSIARALERAQILEEHAFAAEADGRRGARRRPLVLEGARCTPWQLHVSVSPGAEAPARAGRFRGARMDRPLPRAHPHRGCRPTSPHGLRWTCSISAPNRATGCWRTS